jgi:serine/threonine protein kinase
MGNKASTSRDHLDRSGRSSLQTNLVKQTNNLEDTYNISERSLGKGTATNIAQGSLKKYTKTERTRGVAIKLYDGKAEIQPDLKLEAEILRECDHPNIVKLYEVARVGKQLSLVLELCNGGSISDRKPYTEKQASHVVRQICSAIAYLHSKSIVHRDIESSNILYATPEKSEVKLVDFGSAAFLELIPNKPGA